MTVADFARPGCLPAGIPEPGQLMEIVPDVYWARIPLPGRLNHINVWLFRDEDGFTVVDTGMFTGESEDAWQQLLASLPAGARIRRVIVTHLHPDHVGMAGWLIDRGAEQFWMTRSEYLMCRLLVAQSHDDTEPEDFIGFHHAAGWSDHAIRSYRDHYGNYGRRISRLPRAYQRLEEGQIHTLGGYRWRVVVGNGHSPEHACFYCEDMKLLISGDQVLPGISSNVSVTPMEPGANPMADWLNSLRKLRREIPDDVVVMPAHQECFTGLHQRIDALLDSQMESLSTLKSSLRESPKRVVDVFDVLFSRPVAEKDFMIFNLATGEALACLNYLMACGEVEYRDDPQGVRWYSAC